MRKAVGALVYCSIIGIVVGTFAGWSVDAMQAHQFAPFPADADSAEQLNPQSSNWSTKGDRLPSLQQVSLTTDDSNAAPVETGPVTVASIPITPPETPVVAPLPRPPEKPKRPAQLSNAILDDAQIASIRGRLRLTSEQAQYWPAVESALRDVARLQAREARKSRGHGDVPQVDVNSAEVQRLMWAAMPLLGALREDQKREVRMLARVMGLSKVASQI